MIINYYRRAMNYNNLRPITWRTCFWIFLYGRELKTFRFGKVMEYFRINRICLGGRTFPLNLFKTVMGGFSLFYIFLKFHLIVAMKYLFLVFSTIFFRWYCTTKFVRNNNLRLFRHNQRNILDDCISDDIYTNIKILKNKNTL